jgi:hypothetical protein
LALCAAATAGVTDAPGKPKRRLDISRLNERRLALLLKTAVFELCHRVTNVSGIMIRLLPGS